MTENKYDGKDFKWQVRDELAGISPDEFEAAKPNVVIGEGQPIIFGEKGIWDKELPTLDKIGVRDPTKLLLLDKSKTMQERTAKESPAETKIPKEEIDKAVSSAISKEGLRFNQGKLRYDLLEPFAIQELVKVFTKGAEKYAPNNWMKGMDWTKVLASLKRHIAAFEAGEDIDKETECLHMAHAAWNALALTSYYKIAPHFDDRNIAWKNNKRIGCDLDDVIISWASSWCNKFGLENPKHWNFSYNNKARFDSFSKEELDEFYLNLPPAVDPSSLPFEPDVYITARSIDTSITEKWLEKNGFPTVPVHSVGFGQSKVDVAKNLKIDYFIDDSYKNFVELNNAGICTFLWNTPHNQKHNVGYRRIYSFEDFKQRFL